jgi:hypothetical protein
VGLVLFLSVLGVTVVILLIFFGLKGALAPAWKELDEAKAAAARGLQKNSSPSAEPSLPGGRQDQSASIQDSVRVLANSCASSLDRNAERSSGVDRAVPVIVSGEAKQESVVRKEMWVDSHYCWVVLCKNQWFHLRQNLFFRHRIPLAETDPLAPPPSLRGRFNVRCDLCGKEYRYKPSEVLRFEQELPDSFTPHPLFRNC